MGVVLTSSTNEAVNAEPTSKQIAIIWLNRSSSLKDGIRKSISNLNRSWVSKLDLLINAIETKIVEIIEICNPKDIPGLKLKISKNKITNDEVATLIKNEGTSLSKKNNFDLSKSLKVEAKSESSSILLLGKMEEKIA